MGTQSLQTYINQRKVIVSEWVEVRPMFEILAMETDYEGEGKHQETCWRQAAANKQLRATLEEILVAERERWRR